MRFLRQRKQPQPNSAAEATSTPKGTHTDEHLSDFAHRWNALSAGEQAEIRAAVAEQQNFMDAHGINGFHGCLRVWDTTPARSFPTAAQIREETELLRSVLSSDPPA